MKQIHFVAAVIFSLALISCSDDAISVSDTDLSELNLSLLNGFWDTSDPGSSMESYLLVSSDGDGISYIQNPNGDNCFFSEVRNFTALGGVSYVMVSPDSNNISAMLDIIRQADQLNVTLDSGANETWPLVTGLLVADLQICEFTV